MNVERSSKEDATIDMELVNTIERQYSVERESKSSASIAKLQ